MYLPLSLRQAAPRAIAVIFGLWCLYLSFDSTPLAEFEIIGDVAAWTVMAGALSLLVLAPFQILDKQLRNSDGRGARLVRRLGLGVAIMGMLCLLAVVLTVAAFLLAKSYLIIRPFL